MACILWVCRLSPTSIGATRNNQRTAGGSKRAPNNFRLLKLPSQKVECFGRVVRIRCLAIRHTERRVVRRTTALVSNSKIAMPINLLALLILLLKKWYSQSHTAVPLASASDGEKAVAGKSKMLHPASYSSTPKLHTHTVLPTDLTFVLSRVIQPEE